MTSIRRKLWAMAAVTAALWASWALAATPAEMFKKGVQQFEQKQFDQAKKSLLAAHEGRDQLSKPQQDQLADLLGRVDGAARNQQKARAAAKKADGLFAKGKFGNAEALYQTVLKLADFVKAKLLQHAKDRLDTIAKKRALEKPVPAEKPVKQTQPGPKATKSGPQTRPAASAAAERKSVTVRMIEADQQAEQADQQNRAAADAETADGYEALEKGDAREALKHFEKALALSPGHKEAATGKKQAEEQLSAPQGAQTSLLMKLERLNRLRVQKAKAQYARIESQIDQNITSDSPNFQVARQELLRARNVLDAAKSYFAPEEYENYQQRYGNLAERVGQAQEEFEARQIQIDKQRIEQEIQERLIETRRRRDMQKEDLMRQALSLKQNRMYKEAIEPLKEILAIDPHDDRALYLHELLDDMVQFQRQQQARIDREKERHRTLTDADESMTPWTDEIRFPKDWLELQERRKGIVFEEEDAINARVKRKLETIVDRLDFVDTRLDEVLNHFRERYDLNINVKWPVLEEVAEIYRDEAKVNLRLRGVRLKDALDLILENISGFDYSVKLGYDIRGGVITISTLEDLNQRTVTRVYTVRDLLLSIPRFTGSANVDLNSLQQGGATTSGQGFGAGRGGGGGQQTFQQGTGAGSGVAGGAQQEETVTTDDLIQIIQETIDFESWRENGGSATIRALTGRLIVTQTTENHNKIAELLEMLRKDIDIQVAVEARFITVTNNFLEEVGIDLDFVLNQGTAGFDRSGLINTFGNPLLTQQNVGTEILLPRQNSQLGAFPAQPFIGGIPLGTTAFPLQPFGAPGLIPSGRGVGPAIDELTPLPIVQNSLVLTDPVNSQTGVPGSFGGSPIAPALQFFGSFLDNLQVDFLIRATQADARSHVLTAPRIVMFDSQTAFIQVLNQQNVVSGTQGQVGGGGASTQTGSVGTLSAGTVLNVTANISADKKWVRLILRPSITQIVAVRVFQPTIATPGIGTGGGFGQAGVTTQVQLPETQTTMIRTTVSVPDNGTLLIGGQKLAGEVERDAGVPVLSKMPILKRLFSNRSYIKDEQSLIVLVKPKIIIPAEKEKEHFPEMAESKQPS